MLHLDYETACDLDLAKVGLDRYSAHPSCRVLLAAYRIDDGPLQQWEQRDGPLPGELVDALVDPQVERWAFNAQFERVITRRALKIKTPIQGWRCTMCLAYMHSFTGGLGEVGEQIGLPLEDRKKKEGDRLIKLFSMPQKVTTNFRNQWRNWVTDPEDWQRFRDYNRQDVVTEEAIKRRLIRYPVLDDEWSFYELDQLINDRGIPLDFDFVANVVRMSKRRYDDLSREMTQICKLRNPNSRNQMLEWLKTHGYPYEDLQKDTVQKALNLADQYWGCPQDTPDKDAHPVVRVLRRRQWAARSSVRKGETARRTVGRGDRVRFMYQFLGASRTGRFAGRGVQPQNMTRTPKLFDPEDGPDRLNAITDMIRAGDYEAFDLFIEEPMMAFSGAMRSMFRAPDGSQFSTCDYKSVESAGLGWVSGCKRLLDVFQNDLDPYLDFGTLFYQKPYEEVTRAERQICKPPALGCGYRLSAGKVREDGSKTGLMRYAEGMGVEMSFEQAKQAVTVFRRGYPEVPQFWYECEDAVHHVLTTGESYSLGHVTFSWAKPYLLIRLPSGRHIYYYKPRLVWQEIPTGQMIWVKVDGKMQEVEELRTRLVFQYYGRDQHKPGAPWRLINAHGGVTTENIVQALTRDILKVGIQRLHAAGFKIVGHSHDEVITLGRVGDNYYNWETMREIMKEPIAWAPGFPLGAAGWDGPYYRK
jgi:DNA polymerase